MLVWGQDLTVAAVKPLADKEILFGCCGGGALCGFEEAPADRSGALGDSGSFVACRAGIDGVQADGGRVDVHETLRRLRRQFKSRDL